MELKNIFAQDAQGNVIPNPSATLYRLNGTLATGLADKNGDALANPFTGTIQGLLQFSAPEGEYDLRVVGAGRDFTMRVRFMPAGITSQPLEYPTLAAAQAANIVNTINAIRTQGRASVGDGGAAIWTRAGSEPSHPGKFQDASSAWWVLAEKRPIVEHFANIHDAAAWSGAVGLPVKMTAGAVYTISSALTMPEGGQLLNPDGLYNFVTRTVSPPRQKSMACIRLASGFAGDAIIFAPGSYNARISGAWIDGRAQASGRVVVWQGAEFNPRTQASLDFCWVQGNGTGINVHVEATANEPRMHKVLSTDGGKGFLLEGGDIEANFIAAPYNTVGIHLLATRGRLRSLALESWLCDQNFIFEGAIGDADITSLIGDDSGQHGLKVIARSGEPAPGYTIGRLQISNSSRLSPGDYDDFFEDYSASYFDAGYSRILSCNITGSDARHRVNGIYNANLAFGALVAPTTFHNARLSSGGQADAISLASRKNVALTGWEVFNGTHHPISTVGSATGYHNLIPNGDFDHWADAAPLGMIAAGTGSLSQETGADFVVGTGTALGITGGAGIGDGVLAFVPNAKRYRGKIVTFVSAILNTGTEATALNTRAQIHVNGSLLSGAEQVIQSKSGYQWSRISALIPDDAEYIACKVTPSATAAANGRKIYTDKWSFFEGTASDIPLPAHPLADAGWSNYALVPYTGDAAALDLRYCGARTKVTAATPVKLTGLVNAQPMDELLVQFDDGNTTLVTYGNIKRSDGATTDLKIPAGAVGRFIWDGASWIASFMVDYRERAGTTAQRPSTMTYTGMTYFDTTLSKPIWRNVANTGWVDATGTAA